MPDLFHEWVTKTREEQTKRIKERGKTDEAFFEGFGRSEAGNPEHWTQWMQYLEDLDAMSREDLLAPDDDEEEG